MDPVRYDLIESGRAVPTGALVEWAAAQLSVAKRYPERLESRGVNGPFFHEVAATIEQVQRLQDQQGRAFGVAAGRATPEVNALIDQAVDFWREVRLIAKIEFSRAPDVLIRFRPGVKAGESLRRLSDEIEHALPLLRLYRPQLSWLGVTDAFIARGESLLGRLRQEDARQRADVERLPAPEAELEFQKGRLLDLTRKLVRIGRLEFRNEPRIVGCFSYDIVRSARAAAPRPKGERSIA